MKKRTKEEIQKDWDRMQYIKQICYGMGIVSEEEAPDYWKDRRRLQEEFNNL
jgi:hypothetical protein